jgi:hypothetical protein
LHTNISISTIIFHDYLNTIVNIRFRQAKMEVLLMLPPIATCVGKLVERGFQLSAAEDDMIAARMLLTIISETAESVRYRRDQLSKQLNDKQKEQIEGALSRTDQLLSLSKKALRRRFTTSVPGEAGVIALSDRLIWIFKDKGKVVTYQTVLGMLHGVLLGINTELGILKSMPVDAEPEPQSPVDDIYSEFSRSAIVTGLTTYRTTSTVESGDLYSTEAKVTIVEDLKRTYEERMRRQLARNNLEDMESEVAAVTVELSITSDLQRRFADRIARVSDISEPEWTRSNSIASDLQKRFEMSAANTAGVV